MFDHVFAIMNETLDEIMTVYLEADDKQKQELDQQLNILTTISDSFAQQWLEFETKLNQFHSNLLLPEEPLQIIPEQHQLTQVENEWFERGQGYYTLLMYDQAIHLFEKIVEKRPEFLQARIYLGMGYMRIGNDTEALRQFQFVLPLTTNEKMKAVTYNALACIHVKRKNIEQALQYFQLAYNSDPAYLDPFILP